MSDWPQWRGPHRNGISSERLNAWGPRGPRRLWTAQIGQGFSSVAVSGGRIYTLGNAAGTDWVHCLDALTGKIVWQHRYPQQPGDYSGPRSTPTVHQGRVYTLSREGLALCLDAAKKRVLWQANLAQQTRAEVPGWGLASSPLIVGNSVFYCVGAAGCALDKSSGRILWSSGGGPPGFSSPVPFAAGGQSGIALFAGKGLVAVNPANGRQLWRHPWETSYDVNAADPIFSGDSVFISSNYGKGGALLRLAGGRPQVVWETRSMKNHFNSCVLVNGHLYGNDENTLRCIEWRSGQERWAMRGMDKGGLIAVGDKLLALTGRGELTLLAANPQKLTELARAPILSGTCWTQPTLANGLVYARSAEGNLVCMDLRG